MKNAEKDNVPEVLSVTRDQIRALSAKDAIYAAGAELMIRRGLWVLKDENVPQEASK
ncbi:MAG TPA: hypothetical protein O0Y06_08035 [Methanocorpusculum sp.]|nr:hypothetical protein [Methanocorpusculum sp.]HJK80834.1 hypothetical protein [Methanocorpusculum sp.]